MPRSSDRRAILLIRAAYKVRTHAAVVYAMNRVSLPTIDTLSYRALLLSRSYDTAIMSAAVGDYLEHVRLDTHILLCLQRVLPFAYPIDAQRVRFRFNPGAYFCLLQVYEGFKLDGGLDLRFAGGIGAFQGLALSEAELRRLAVLHHRLEVDHALELIDLSGLCCQPLLLSTKVRLVSVASPAQPRLDTDAVLRFASGCRINRACAVFAMAE